MSAFAYGDPPADVVQAITAAKEACKWYIPTVPVTVGDRVVRPPPPPSYEAQVCSMLKADSPDVVLWKAAELGGAAAFILTVILFWFGVHRIPLVVWGIGKAVVQHARAAR